MFRKSLKADCSVKGTFLNIIKVIAHMSDEGVDLTPDGLLQRQAAVIGIKNIANIHGYNYSSETNSPHHEQEYRKVL